MRVEFRFYATLRDAVGEKAVVREVDEGATVGEALGVVADDYDGLGPMLFRSDGGLRPQVTVALNGDPLAGGREGVRLSEDDALVLSPGVAGGREEPR